MASLEVVAGLASLSPKTVELLKGRKKLAKLGAACVAHLLYILGNGHSAVMKKMLMIKCCGVFIVTSCVSCCYDIVGDHQ